MFTCKICDLPVKPANIQVHMNRAHVNRTCLYINECKLRNRTPNDIHERIGIEGYWATSISTVRNTVLSTKVIKTNLFPDLDIPLRILDII